MNGCSSSPSNDASAPASSSVAARATAAPGFTLLARDVHRLATPEHDRGRVDESAASAGSVYLRPSPSRLAAREARLTAVQDPRSPLYHRWLDAEDYAAQFGATAEDIARVTSFLEAHGLVVDGPSRIGTRVGFHGTTAAVEDAFRAEIHHYSINGKMHVAMAETPSVPTELASTVLGLRGLHDIRLHPKTQRTPLPLYKDPSDGLTLGPADFGVLYDTAPLLAAGTKGQGVNLVVVGETTVDKTDLSSFRTQFGLTNHETDVLVPGTGKAYLSTDDEDESELDLEWAAAVAPGANIVFVSTGSDAAHFGVDDAAAYAIEEGTHLVPGVGNGAAQIVSESYGGCEALYPADADIDGEIAAAANLEGITYVAASGDTGAAGCFEYGIGGLYTGPPASLPGVTGVGGTEFLPAVQVSPFFVDDVAKQYPLRGTTSLESVWNDQAAGNGGGGGGRSILFPKPFYQQDVTPADGARDVPDVALTASSANVGYEVFEGGSLGSIGGTSASTPAFAGILALVNQSVAAKGGALGLGNVNPLLYQLSKSTPSVFHDIVSGDNVTPCNEMEPACPPSGSYGGYSATAGYDLATGLGSVDAAKLVDAWTVLAPTTTTLGTSATSVDVNAPLTLIATIAASPTGSAHATMTGSVTFAFETLAGAIGEPYAVDAGGGFDSSWLLGTVPVTANANGGTAVLATEVPPGLYGKAFLVATYDGDQMYMSSISAPSAVSVTGATLAITTATIALAPGESTTFATTGGAPPLLWQTRAPDTTCIVTGLGSSQDRDCSRVEAESKTSGYFRAGPHAGTVRVVAIDTQGQEAVVDVTVSGAPVDAGPYPDFDAGPAGGPGEGPVLSFDASVPDAAADGAGVDASVAPSGDADDAGDADASAPPNEPASGPTDGTGGDASAAPPANTSHEEDGSSGGCSVLAGDPATGAADGYALAVLGLALVLMRRTFSSQGESRAGRRR